MHPNSPYGEKYSAAFLTYAPNGGLCATICLVVQSTSESFRRYKKESIAARIVLAVGRSS